jgi:hypothetical protein
MKPEFSRQIFEKYSDIKCYEIPSSGSRVPYGQTDRATNRHDEANGLFSQFLQTRLKTHNRGILILCLHALFVCHLIQNGQRLVYRRHLTDVISVPLLSSALWITKSLFIEWKSGIKQCDLFCTVSDCCASVGLCVSLCSPVAKRIQIMRRLTTGMCEKCVVSRFRRCENVYLNKPR